MKQNETGRKRFDYNKIRSSSAAKLLYDSGVPYFILAFLIPAAIMLYAFSKEKIHPFGDNQMLVVDLWHQYYPFFKVLREKLVNGGSFLYSWNTGLGTNFLSLIAYYAMSPLNWIAALFDEEHSRDLLMYFLVAKIGFCGAFYSCFLRYTYRHKDLSIVVFSSMFALCSYMLGYYWNVMWFDTIALFPLVMTGVVAICRERKWKLYTFALALSLICNYYIGFMVCVFTVFMFAAAFIAEDNNIRSFFPKLWITVRSSAIAIGLGGFILLPAYRGLQLAYKSAAYAPSKLSFKEKWYDLIARLMPYQEPTSVEGLVNIACGTLPLMLFGVFLFSGKIKLRERIPALFTLAVLLLSINIPKLNYFWHGFHTTNGLPYRYSFIFCFVLIAIGFRAYDIFISHGIKLYHFLAALLLPALVFAARAVSVTKGGEAFGVKDIGKSTLFILGAYLAVFVTVKLLRFRSPVVCRTVMNIALAAAVLTELTGTAVIGVKKVGSSDYESYPVYYKGVEAVLATMEQQEDKLFSRTEITNQYTLNDGAAYGYNGLSQFSSTANGAMTKLMVRLGMYGSEPANRYYYRTSDPLVNGLFGLDHLISKGGLMKNSSEFFDMECSDSNVYLYRNRYPLSLGFMMDPDILRMPDDGGANPFEYRNQLVRLATGTEEGLFIPQPVSMVSYDNVEVTKTSFGKYEYAVTDPAKKAKCVYEYAGTADHILYGYAQKGAFETLQARCDGQLSDKEVDLSKYAVVFPLGDGHEGSAMSVEFMLNDPKEAQDGSSGNSAKLKGSYTLMVYGMDMNVFEKCYEALADEQFNITEFSDTRIKGEIDALERGILYFSIPYEKGWRVYVDGEETRTMEIMNAMLGVEVGSGHHEIALEFAPDGFPTGLVISGGALLILVIVLVNEIGRIKKRRKKNESYVLPEKKTKMDDISGAEVSRDLGEAGLRIHEKSEGDDSVSGN